MKPQILCKRRIKVLRGNVQQ